MGKLFVAGAIASVVSLAFAPALGASDQFAASFDMSFSRSAPAVSAGLSAHMSWSDPGEPAGKPRAIKQIVLAFPPGVRFDTTALPSCRASDDLLRARGPGACPRRSQVGTGATMVNPGGGPPFATRVSFFNARRQVIVVVEAGANVISVFRDEIRGATLVIRPVIPPGFALTDLRARFLAHGRRHAGRRRAYFRTPVACPAEATWTTVATFTYTDGFSQQLKSASPCTTA